MRTRFALGRTASPASVRVISTGWTIEQDGAIVVVRDVWRDNPNHAAWLVATKVGLPLDGSPSGAGRDE